MKVREILKAKGTKVVTAHPDESVRALVRRFREERIGALVVVSEAGVPVGLVSERDVVTGSPSTASAHSACGPTS